MRSWPPWPSLITLALVAWWVIRLGVRPIKQMTGTATAIADGDLTQRVPQVDPRTEAGQLGAALDTMLSHIEHSFRAIMPKEAIELGFHPEQPTPAHHGHRLQPDAADTGRFAYGSATYITGILEKAGWVNVKFSPHELVLYVGGPGTTPEQAVDMGRNLGPLGVLLNEASPEIVDAVTKALVDELAGRWGRHGRPPEAATAIVSARPR